NRQPKSRLLWSSNPPSEKRQDTPLSINSRKFTLFSTWLNVFRSWGEKVKRKLRRMVLSIKLLFAFSASLLSKNCTTKGSETFCNRLLRNEASNNNCWISVIGLWFMVSTYVAAKNVLSKAAVVP